MSRKTLADWIYESGYCVGAISKALLMIISHAQKFGKKLAHEDALPQHGGREQVRLLRCSPLYPGEGENYGHPIQRSTDALHQVREASALRAETALL